MRARPTSLFLTAAIALLACIVSTAAPAQAESNRRVCYQVFDQYVPELRAMAEIAIWGKTSISDQEACDNIHAAIAAQKDSLLAQTHATLPAGLEGNLDPKKWEWDGWRSNEPCETLADDLRLGGDPCPDHEVTAGPADSVRLHTTPAVFS